MKITKQNKTKQKRKLTKRNKTKRKRGGNWKKAIRTTLNGVMPFNNVFKHAVPTLLHNAQLIPTTLPHNDTLIPTTLPSAPSFSTPNSSMPNPQIVIPDEFLLSQNVLEQNAELKALIEFLNKKSKEQITNNTEFNSSDYNAIVSKTHEFVMNSDPHYVTKNQIQMSITTIIRTCLGRLSNLPKINESIKLTCTFLADVYIEIKLNNPNKNTNIKKLIDDVLIKSTKIFDTDDEIKNKLDVTRLIILLCIFLGYILKSFTCSESQAVCEKIMDLVTELNKEIVRMDNPFGISTDE